MENIIITDTKNAILNAVNMYLRNKGASIDINQINAFRTVREHKPAQFGVNWAACGTQLPGYTKQFAENLAEAAHICEVLNFYEWIEKWVEDAYETDDDYRKDIYIVYDGLNGGHDIKKLIDMII